jgi:hypothetical protein
MKYWPQLLIFILSSVIQVRFIDAKDYVIPAEVPENCIKENSLPCAVTTGDQPRLFRQQGSVWELDRNIVLKTDQRDVWDIYSGLLVLKSEKEQVLHTPFADIHVGKSKVMIHVLEQKVRVLSLDGEGVKVRPKGDPEEHFLVPGFQNWYGGITNGMSESGVVSVIDFEKYSKERAIFFMNHELGFTNELSQVAKVVKWATRVASQMHRELVERKMASLEFQHKEKVIQKKKKIQFNKYLRRLFLKKIRYDD